MKKRGGGCNVQLADEIMLISIISPMVIFACTKQLDIHKTRAVTLTGKRPPNRDPEWQRTELVQDTRALMVPDTKALMVPDTKTGDEAGRPVMETDSHFPACEPALQKERHGSSYGV